MKAAFKEEKKHSGLEPRNRNASLPVFIPAVPEISCLYQPDSRRQLGKDKSVLVMDLHRTRQADLSQESRGQVRLL